MSSVPPDLEGAVPELAALLWTLPPEQTEVGFDQLRELCLSAITVACRPRRASQPGSWPLSWCSGRSVRAERGA